MQAGRCGRAWRAWQEREERRLPGPGAELEETVLARRARDIRRVCSELENGRAGCGYQSRQPGLEQQFQHSWLRDPVTHTQYCFIHKVTAVISSGN